MAEKSNDIEAIYNTALTKESEAERSAYLDAVCGDDHARRARVEALIKAHEQAGDFLEVPVVDPGVTLESPLSEAPGTVIGRYRLLEKIGEGGMAVVYMAEQKRPIRRKVALKIIKLGMDTKQVIARFEAERQALAMMDHPNVAHVYDAGTTETGRPYFVMELVRGVSITEYCDKNKLSTRQRLELFIAVCNAVQHAHHKGIIHRDLKPSNIMVTLHDGKPVSKVIDFGVAKATNQELTEKTLFTRYAQMIGTPEYMSPEQAEMSGLDIDTRSDVYSLGVVLYELLTGVPPFDPDTMASAALGEIRRIIQEEEPLRPSSKLSSLGEDATRVAQSHGTEVKTLVKCLHQELEWIPLKAMRKDRTRRYQSVLELADDIQNYLDGAPLSAGPESVVYRARKFVRRNRVLVTGVAAVLAVLITGVVVSTLFAVGQARARAEAEAVSDFLRKDLLASMDPSKTVSPFLTTGREVTIRSFLDLASEKLEGKFPDKPLVEASIRQTLGQVYVSFGLYLEADSHLNRALKIHQAQLGADDPATLVCTRDLGWLHFMQGRYNDAEPLLADATQGLERMLGEEHSETLLSVVTLGWVYNMLGRLDDAERLFAGGLETSRRMFGPEDPNTQRFREGLAYTYHRQGRYHKAQMLFEKALTVIRVVPDEESLYTLRVMSWLADLYQDLSRYNEAEQLMDEVLARRDHVLGSEHLETLAAMGSLGGLYVLQGRYEQAESKLVGALETAKTAGLDDHTLIAVPAFWLGYLYILQERYDEAEPLLIQLLEVAHGAFGEEHWAVVTVMARVGGLHTAQGRYNEAEHLLVQACETGRSVLGQEHPTTLLCMNGMAVLRSKQKRYDEAEDLFTKALEGRRQKLGGDHPDTLETLHDFGVMYLEQGRHEQAETKLLAAYEGRAAKLGPEHPMTLKTLNNLIRLYEAWNKSEEAQKWRTKLPLKQDAHEQ